MDLPDVSKVLAKSLLLTINTFQIVFFNCHALIFTHVAQYLLSLYVSSCVIASEEPVLEELALEGIDLLFSIHITLLAALIGRSLHRLSKLLSVAD